MGKVIATQGKQSVVGPNAADFEIARCIAFFFEFIVFQHSDRRFIVNHTGRFETMQPQSGKSKIAISPTASDISP